MFPSKLIAGTIEVRNMDELRGGLHPLRKLSRDQFTGMSVSINLRYNKDQGYREETW